MDLRNLRPLAATLIAGIAALAVVSCSDMGTQSRSDVNAQLAWQEQSVQDATPALLDGIDIDGAYTDPLLDGNALAKPSGAKAKLLDFAESNDDSADITTRRWLLKAQEISAAEGGTIVFGTDRIGYSMLEIPAGALDHDTLIQIVHKLRGKRDVYLFPEGTVFNKAVTLRFSLDGLNQRQTNKLLNMRLYYHDPDPDGNPNTDDGGWQLIPSYSDGHYVIATLEHFSRYAVGSDE